MALAIKEAELAFNEREVPVGAVLVDRFSGEIVSKAHNLVEKYENATFHAEMLLINQYCDKCYSYEANFIGNSDFSNVSNGSNNNDVCENQIYDNQNLSTKGMTCNLCAVKNSHKRNSEIYNDSFLDSNSNVRKNLKRDGLARDLCNSSINSSSAHNKNKKFLDNFDLFVTLEPCPMCAYALHLARVHKVIFGAYIDDSLQNDEKVAKFTSDTSFHRFCYEEIGGVCQKECEEILLNFFKSVRD